MTLKKCKSGNKGFKIIREILFMPFEVETFEKIFLWKDEWNFEALKIIRISLVIIASLSIIESINLVYSP